ncbi:MAG TPA: two-component regulator propeller domain-containing protein [Bacteroidia bacterium]|jgi:two-component sensor histidine kinase/ligand-binding sensor domain-containing protein|nr:two-component regulator propeller domain-containing protein [Bacteroidia bacterium]
MSLYPHSKVIQFLKAIFLLFAILFADVSVHAQVADFISYGVEEGLSQSEVQCIYQDSRGYLWVGTTGGGVCSFDGVTFKEYGKKNGLVGQVVNAITEDSTGELWFGTQLGANRYDGKSFTTFAQGEIGFNEVSSLISEKNSEWIAGSGGISEVQLATGSAKRIYTARAVHNLCLDKEGTIWASAGKSLLYFKGYACDSVDLKLPADYSGMIMSLRDDGHGLLYIGLTDRLIIYRPSAGTFTENNFTEILKGRTVHCVYPDQDGNIWASTTSNLVAIYHPDGSISTFNSSNGLTAEGVFMVLEDNTHHMWFATREQSLLKLRSRTFSYFGNLPGMGSTSVFKIEEDRNGKMWIGSNQDGLYCFDGKTSVPILNNGQAFKQPIALAEDKNGMWVGHYDGASYIQNGRVTKTILQGKRVRSLLYDTKGNLWAGTWGLGLFEIEPGGKINTYTAENGSIIGNFVHCLAEDRKGNIWIGTGSGLSKYDGRSFRSFSVADGLCNSYVGSLVIDPYDHVWFHTDACIMRYDGNSFMSYTDDNGLVSNTFYLLAFDKDSDLWVGTNKGIDKVRVGDDGSFKSVKNYSRNEGFRGIECNSRAVCVTHDGCIWFGTVKGVIRFNPLEEEREITPPIIHLTAIRLFLEQYDWTWSGVEESGFYHLPVKLDLDNERNHLTFVYGAVHLQSPQLLKYQFMLTGFDSTWQPVTTATEITYTNLPPGKYVFKVKAILGNGEIETAPASSCDITIAPPPPPFYARWWFICLSLIVIGGMLYYIIVGRTKMIIRQKQLLEAEVNERTAEIRRQNEEKTLMLKEIHHRVKNNLQVISSLLNLQADGITDKRVLVLFEDLRHRINSMALIHEKMYQSKNLVNIDIGNYIDELVRSLIDAYDSNKAIHLKADIEEHPFRIDTIVPLGLILNEIISNSLKYAFADRNEGNLYVSLRKLNDGKFLLEVSDDGKGIPANVKFETAESLGMQLIQMLSGQINAKVEVDTKNGTRYRIEFTEEIKDRF